MHVVMSSAPKSTASLARCPGGLETGQDKSSATFAVSDSGDISNDISSGKSHAHAMHGA
jgi:hypothetical protein